MVSYKPANENMTVPPKTEFLKQGDLNKNIERMRENSDNIFYVKKISDCLDKCKCVCR